jgi:hypothetical protein
VAQKREWLRAMRTAHAAADAAQTAGGASYGRWGSPLKPYCACRHFWVRDTVCGVLTRNPNPGPGCWDFAVPAGALLLPFRLYRPKSPLFLRPKPVYCAAGLGRQHNCFTIKRWC